MCSWICLLLTDAVSSLVTGCRSECVHGLPASARKASPRRLALVGVRVDERRDVFGDALPNRRELSLRDQLSHAIAHQVGTDDGAVDATHDLDDARGADDLAATVAGQVVLVRADGLGT